MSECNCKSSSSFGIRDVLLIMFLVFALRACGDETTFYQEVGRYAAEARAEFSKGFAEGGDP